MVGRSLFLQTLSFSGSVQEAPSSTVWEGESPLTAGTVEEPLRRGSLWKSGLMAVGKRVCGRGEVFGPEPSAPS